MKGKDLGTHGELIFDPALLFVQFIYNKHSVKTSEIVKDDDDGSLTVIVGNLGCIVEIM